MADQWTIEDLRSVVSKARLPTARTEVEGLEGPAEISDVQEMAAQGAARSAMSNVQQNIPGDGPIPWAPFKGKRTPEEYAAANATPGVSLVQNEPLGNATRLGIGARRTKADQYSFLVDSYGEKNIKMDDKGDWLIRKTGPDGKQRDITLNEQQMTLGDFFELAGEAPELIMSFASTAKAMTKFAGVTLKNIAQQAIAGAVGYSATGAAKDVGVRAISGDSPQFIEIAGARSAEAALDTVMGVGMGKLANFITAAPVYLSAVVPDTSDIAKAAREGVEGIAQYPKVELTQTGAEISGSPTMAGLRAYADRLPFMKGIARNRQATKEARELMVAQRMLGPVPTKEIGPELRQAVMGGADAAEAGVESTRKQVMGEAVAEVQGSFKPFDGATMGRSEYNLGKDLIGSAKRSLEESNVAERELYGRVYELDESRSDVMSLKPIADKAKEMLDTMSSVPASPEAVMEISKLLDARGKPSVTERIVEGTGRESISELTDNEAVKRLTALSERGEQKTRLFDLVQMRDRLYQAVRSKDDVLGSLGVHNLKGLASSITQAIKEGTEALPSGELRERLLAANANHIARMEKFGRATIEPLLKESAEAGAQAPESLVRKLMGPKGEGGVSSWQEMSDFFGYESPEIQSVRQYFQEQVMKRSMDDVTMAIDGEKLLKSMDGIQPEILTEVFGSSGPRIQEIAREMIALKGGTSPRLSQQDFLALVQDPKGASRDRVKRMMAAEQKRDDVYKNSIIEAYKNGDSITIEPKEFIQRIVDGNHSPAAVQQVMDVIRVGSPEVSRQIERNYLLGLFKKATDKHTTPDEFLMRLRGQELDKFSPKAWMDYMGQEDVRRTMKIMLSPAKAGAVENMGKYMAAAAMVEAEKGSIGGIAGQMITTNLILMHLKGMSNAAKMLVMTGMLSSENAGRLLTMSARNPNLAVSPGAVKAITGAFLNSSELYRFISEQSTDPEELERIVNDIKRGEIMRNQPDPQ